MDKLVKLPLFHSGDCGIVARPEYQKIGDFNFMFGQLSQLVESFPDTEDVTGSNPVLTTESRNNGKPPLPYGSQSVNLVKWGK